MSNFFKQGDQVTVSLLKRKKKKKQNHERNKPKPMKKETK